MRNGMIAAVLLSAVGCVKKPDPIPNYALLDVDGSLALLRQRSAGLKTVQSEGAIRMTDAAGKSVSLDGAFVFAPPSRARLRAWKFGQAVFDLTLRDGQAWAYLPRDEAKPSAPKLKESLGQWLELLGGGEHAFDGEASLRGDDIVITRPQANGTTLRITIDRQTLTPRQYCLFTDDRIERFRLELSDYRLAGDGQVWPTAIKAISAQGVVEIECRDVEANGEIDPAAFRPPARADVLP